MHLLGNGLVTPKHGPFQWVLLIFLKKRSISDWLAVKSGLQALLGLALFLMAYLTLAVIQGELFHNSGIFGWEAG